MEAFAAAMAAMRAKDTTLSTLSRMLAPPELGGGERSDSESDDAEAHLQPYAVPHGGGTPAAPPASSALGAGMSPQMVLQGLFGISSQTQPPGLVMPAAGVLGQAARAAASAPGAGVSPPTAQPGLQGPPGASSQVPPTGPVQPAAGVPGWAARPAKGARGAKQRQKDAAEKAAAALASIEAQAQEGAPQVSEGERERALALVRGAVLPRAATGARGAKARQKDAAERAAAALAAIDAQGAAACREGTPQVSEEERERALALLRSAVLPRPQVRAWLSDGIGRLAALLQGLAYTRACGHDSYMHVSRIVCREGWIAVLGDLHTGWGWAAITLSS